MEDAMILNKSSVERGLAHGTLFKSEAIDLREDKGKSQVPARACMHRYCSSGHPATAPQHATMKTPGAVFLRFWALLRAGEAVMHQGWRGILPQWKGGPGTHLPGLWYCTNDF